MCKFITLGFHADIHLIFYVTFYDLIYIEFYTFCVFFTRLQPRWMLSMPFEICWNRLHWWISVFRSKIVSNATDCFGIRVLSAQIYAPIWNAFAISLSCRSVNWILRVLHSTGQTRLSMHSRTTERFALLALKTCFFSHTVFRYLMNNNESFDNEIKGIFTFHKINVDSNDFIFFH